MAKTKEIEFKCSGGGFNSLNYNQSVVTIEDPNVDELLSGIHEDDVVDYVSSNFNVEDVFSEKDLKKWAEENGYTK